MTFTQYSNHTVIVKFPNNLPLAYATNLLTSNGLPLVFGNWGATNEYFKNNVDEHWNKEPRAVFYSGSCYRTHIYEPQFEYIDLELYSSFSLGGRLVPTTEDIQPFCIDIFANPPPLMDCSLENQNHINLRGESVCVKSIEKLIDRDYLV